MAEGRSKTPPEPHDWYVEQPEVTAYLLARERFHGGIWDPSCGMGNIIKACEAAGYDAVGTDLIFRPRYNAEYWWRGEGDFVTAKWVGPLAPNIINNPPYGSAKLAEAFIRRALTMGGISKAAFLVNAKFLFGGRRAAGLYRDHPPSRVYPISPRPSIPPGSFIEAGGKVGGGVENFCWLVYDLSAPRGDSSIHWGGG